MLLNILPLCLPSGVLVRAVPVVLGRAIGAACFLSAINDRLLVAYFFFLAHFPFALIKLVYHDTPTCVMLGLPHCLPVVGKTLRQPVFSRP
jgi:hypothetical protein